MPPPSLPCPHCGRALFKHSMAFHVEKCALKQETMMVDCPACGMQLPNSELNAHMSKCRAVRAQGACEAGGCA